MRLRNRKSGNTYSTINRHERMPSYFKTSHLGLDVTIDGETVKMVLNPKETGIRVNFSLKNDEYLFIDNQSLWEEVNQKHPLDFELVNQNGQNGPKSRKSGGIVMPRSENLVKLGPCHCPKTYIFRSLEDLHEACKKKVECDNAAFNYQSVYLPNPVVDNGPSYVFVALEPSISLRPIVADVTPDQFREYVEKDGFKNFMRSNKSFILRYCIREFLGNAHITDFSKGAIPPNVADENRLDRFTRWLPILKAELVLLKSPKVYALGNAAERYLRRFNIRYRMIRENGNLRNVLHPSPQNNGRFAQYYREHSHGTAEEIPSAQTFKAFAEEFMKGQKFSEGLRALIAKSFRFDRDSDKGVFLYYRDKFREIRGSSS